MVRSFYPPSAARDRQPQPTVFSAIALAYRRGQPASDDPQ
jgi:hypothetical protein